MSENKIKTGSSYSPYSGQQESCYIEGSSGLLYPGVKIENISYPLTISAVQAAVCSCLANGDTPETLYQPGVKSDLLKYWVDEFKLRVLNEQPASENPIYNPVSEISDNIDTELQQLCDKAVTIHSDFPVSAILITEAGAISGVNVEVSVWALGLCAERVALSRAISAGITAFRFMHVYAPKSEFCSPCGACRQVLNEFMPKSMVYLHHTASAISKHFVEHLLPYGITSASLKNK